MQNALRIYQKKSITKSGHRQHCKKAELLKLCEDYGIVSINEKSSKEDMIDALTRTFCVNAFAEFYGHNGLGISSYEYQHKFQISGEEVKRMERLEFIHCVGFERFRKYGKQLKAPVYDIFEFYSLTPEKVRWFLKVNPKGTRKTQVRYE